MHLSGRGPNDTVMDGGKGKRFSDIGAVDFHGRLCPEAPDSAAAAFAATIKPRFTRVPIDEQSFCLIYEYFSHRLILDE